MYTWHFTFDDQPDLHDLVRRYQARMAHFPGLDPIPVRWLHLTTQGLGFTDEVSEEVVSAVVEGVRTRLADIAPIRLHVGPAVVDPEVVRLRVAPADALTPVRSAIREAITTVTGSVDEPEGWNPHISVAYSNAEGPMAPITTVLADELPPVQVTVSDVQLILLGRDEHCYTWDTKAIVHFES
jgi:hypothetical protein